MFKGAFSNGCSWSNESLQVSKALHFVVQKDKQVKITSSGPSSSIHLGWDLVKAVTYDSHYFHPHQNIQRTLVLHTEASAFTMFLHSFILCHLSVYSAGPHFLYLVLLLTLITAMSININKSTLCTWTRAAYFFPSSTCGVMTGKLLLVSLFLEKKNPIS